jgi:hypothetical protein
MNSPNFELAIYNTIPLLISLMAGSMIFSGCTTTGTDPSLIPPNVRLEVFATMPGTTNPDPRIDISVDGSDTSPQTAKDGFFYPKDVAVRVTGAQLDRGLGKVEVTLTRGTPFECSRTVAGTGEETTPVISAPSQIRRSTPPLEHPQGILILDYPPNSEDNPLVEFVKNIRCVAGYYPGGRIFIDVLAKTSNIAGKETSTPVLHLRPTIEK